MLLLPLLSDSITVNTDSPNRIIDLMSSRHDNNRDKRNQGYGHLENSIVVNKS